MKYFIAVILNFVFSPVICAAGSHCINFTPEHFQHIRFDDIAASSYEFSKDGKQVNIEVKSSASFLFMPFEKKVSVRSISYEWQPTSQLPLTNEKQLSTKKGDDLPLRIGLVVYGRQQYFSFLLPSWLKEIEKHLKMPSDHLVYVASGRGLGEAGRSWESPYSSSISSIVATEKQVGPWVHASHRFASAKEIVGLWIMSDGDDQKTQFKLNLRRLYLKSE